MNIAIVLVSEISRPKVDYYCLFVSVLAVLPWCAGHSTMLRGYWRHCLCIASLITPCLLPTSLRCAGRRNLCGHVQEGVYMCVGVCVCRVQGEGICVGVCREGFVCGRVRVQSAERRIVCGHMQGGVCVGVCREGYVCGCGREEDVCGHVQGGGCVGMCREEGVCGRVQGGGCVGMCREGYVCGHVQGGYMCGCVQGEGCVWVCAGRGMCVGVGV